MKVHLVALAALAVAACTPGIPIPIPAPKPAPVPASEVVDPAAVTPRDGAGVIVVTRDRWLKGMRCRYDLALDGQRVASLRSGEQVTLYADPGARLLEVSIGAGGPCEPALAQVPVRVVAGSTTNIRVTSDLSYDLRIESTSY
jgi:hypothetical protein